MNSVESANIRPLNPDNPRSSDTVHPGSSNLSDFVEGPLPDDDLNLDIPLDVSINSPPRDQLREADTEYPFNSPILDQPSTPLPNRAVRRLLDQDGDMASPLSSPPIVANDGVLSPLSEKIEPTQWGSQQELAEVNGVPTDIMEDYSPAIETGMSDSPETVDQDYFSPRSDDVRDKLVGSVVDTYPHPSVEELIKDLEISQEQDRERDSMDTSYPTLEKLSSDDDPEASTKLVSPLTPPLTPPLSPDPSPNVSDVGGIEVKLPRSSAHSDSGGTSYFVHVSEAGETSLTALTPTLERDGSVSYSAMNPV